jgi:predicted Zn-dependent protease
MRLSRSRLTWIGGIGALILVALGLGLAGWNALDRDPNLVFARADRAFKDGRYVDADIVLGRLARLRQPTPVDRLLRAEVAIARDRPEQALTELAAIPDPHPLAPLARLRTGQIEIRRGRTRPAEAAFLASLKLVPRAVQPRKELVYIYNVQHRQAELDAMLADLLDLDALDFQYILHWTKTRNTVWNPRGDLPALERFVAADPADRWSRLALAEAMRRLDRLDDAERVLATVPLSDARARTERVLIAIGRGEIAAAEALLAASPEDDPRLAVLRGQLALRRHDGAAAARNFRTAVAADPLDRAALFGLGTALGMIGQPDVAKPCLDAAARHDALGMLVSRAATTEGERDPGLPRQLGMACAAVGRNHEARAWLKLAIQRNPLDTECQQTLFELEHNRESRAVGGERSAPCPCAGRGRAARSSACRSALGRPHAGQSRV